MKRDDSMLVLGRKYKFTELELKRLQKKFKNIKITRYTDRDQNEVLWELEKSLKSSAYDLLVLNTKVSVGDEIIKYLTSLQFVKRKKPLKVMSIEHFMEKYLHKCYIPEDNSDLDFLEEIQPYSKFEYFQKRALDYFIALTFFMTAWPLIYIVKYKMSKESPGKLYFKQERVGELKKIFQCRKFRTMHENSYHDPYTRENDNRIYPFGEFMRKTRIDELPQMLNVLRGEMHVIGPRAEWSILVEEYEKKLPYYHERHLVKPGITGWAQVMYPYGANLEDTRQKLMYDLYYIKNWNLLLELKIIYKTILVVLGKKGM
jgi:lipopolysaccharide/colanic/teichoic acid biosynthesis glycosyltransferase